MKIEVWSDVVCPFCYIGKRKYEAALEQFEYKDEVELVWKSYQLSPEIKTNPSKTAIQSLAEEKGISLAQAEALTQQVTQRAKEAGLTYRFDKAIAVNTFNAHRFSHLAKHHGKQNEAEEVLFRSYFSDGENIDDYSTLIQLGKEIGLNTDEVKSVLESDKYADEVQADIYEAYQVDVQSVPFFVFNNRYGVSGAQDVDVFLKTLERSFREWKQANEKRPLDVIDGESCSVDGNCK